MAKPMNGRPMVLLILFISLCQRVSEDAPKPCLFECKSACLSWLCVRRYNQGGLV